MNIPAIVIFIAFIATIILIVVLVKYFEKVRQRNIETTKQLSKLYANILEINKKYKFNKIEDDSVEFYPTLNSKRSLDNFIIKDFVMDKIEESRNWFIKLLEKAEENDTLYKQYTKDYAKAEKYITLEEFKTYENVKMSYKTFVKIENELYNESKLNSPITRINIHCHPTYTSPSGRNHYYKDAVYSHNQIKVLIVEVDERMEKRIKEQLIKEEKMRAKREKEKKLRELDKMEKRLKEKEESLNMKEKEFLDATKDQMYSTDYSKPISAEAPQEDDKELTIAQKLKLLKAQFENGEITYAEYQAKRKDLM